MDNKVTVSVVKLWLYDIGRRQSKSLIVSSISTRYTLSSVVIIEVCEFRSCFFFAIPLGWIDELTIPTWFLLTTFPFHFLRLASVRALRELKKITPPPPPTHPRPANTFFSFLFGCFLPVSLSASLSLSLSLFRVASPAALSVAIAPSSATVAVSESASEFVCACGCVCVCVCVVFHRDASFFSAGQDSAGVGFAVLWSRTVFWKILFFYRTSHPQQRLRSRAPRVTPASDAIVGI